jgi:large subunit ribosomal protein L21
MYAIIAESGRQYKVEEGQIVEVDCRDVSAGDRIEFARVLAISSDEGVKIGKPVVDGASVSGEVLGTWKGPKLVVQKFRRRKTMRRKTGHRQFFVRVRIDSIKA